MLAQGVVAARLAREGRDGVMVEAVRVVRFVLGRAVAARLERKLAGDAVRFEALRDTERVQARGFAAHYAAGALLFARHDEQVRGPVAQGLGEVVHVGGFDGFERDAPVGVQLVERVAECALRTLLRGAAPPEVGRQQRDVVEVVLAVEQRAGRLRRLHRARVQKHHAEVAASRRVERGELLGGALETVGPGVGDLDGGGAVEREAADATGVDQRGALFVAAIRRGGGMQRKQRLG